MKSNEFSRRNSLLALKELGRIQAPVVAMRQHADIDLTHSAVSPGGKCSPYSLKIGHQSFFYSFAKPRKLSVLCAKAAQEPQILLSLRCGIPVISNM